MIKIFYCKNKNYLNQLNFILDKRKFASNHSSGIVSKIINDIKKNNLKALIKYEKKFSKNKEIKPSKNKQGIKQAKYLTK